MAWTSPTTWSVGAVVTASQLNTQIRDNLRYLKGLDGAVQIENTLQPGYGFNTQFPAAAISIPASTHATSRRALFAVDDWQFMQDFNGNGTKDFAFYQVSAALRRFVIDTSGRVGIGATSPTGQFHVKGAISNWIFFEFDALAGVAQTVLATSSLSYAMAGTAICRPSNGASPTTTSLAANNPTSFNIYNDGGGNNCQLTYASGGFTVARTAGALTYKVSIFLQTL